MRPYDSGTVSQDQGLSRGVREALADPIVQALLVSGVDPGDVADLSRRMAAWPARREATGAPAPRLGFGDLLQGGELSPFA